MHYCYKILMSYVARYCEACQTESKEVLKSRRCGYAKRPLTRVRLRRRLQGMAKGITNRQACSIWDFENHPLGALEGAFDSYKIVCLARVCGRSVNGGIRMGNPLFLR